MDNFFTRYRNEVVLVAILFVQVIALATQVRVPDRAQAGASGGGTRLIRVWTSAITTPVQRLFVNMGSGVRGIWSNYVDLRRTREENERLQAEVNRLRLEQVRVEQDAAQGRRLQGLLDFREQYIARTTAAQVIGTSGTELSQVIYIDKGTRDGIDAGMAVITPDGIVGKVSRADKRTSQVLLITDPNSGAGVILERLRINGILKGTLRGYPEVLNVMSDERIEPGDKIITTGGDQVFPKGLPVGVVEEANVDPKRDPFLAIKVKPAVNLGKLEEVLVITELAEREPQQTAGAEPIRASDILAQRLPSAKKKTEAKTAPTAPRVSDIPAVVTPPEPGVFSGTPQTIPQNRPNPEAGSGAASTTPKKTVSPATTQPKMQPKTQPKTEQTQPPPSQQNQQPSTPPPSR